MCIVPWLLCVAFTGGSPPCSSRRRRQPRRKYADAARTRGRTAACARHADAQKARIDRAWNDEHRPEVWRGTGCYKGAHRRRLWSFRESFTLAVDPSCLRRHLALNKTTWDDLDGISVRARQDSRPPTPSAR